MLLIIVSKHKKKLKNVLGLSVCVVNKACLTDWDDLIALDIACCLVLIMHLLIRFNGPIDDNVLNKCGGAYWCLNVVFFKAHTLNI